MTHRPAASVGEATIDRHICVLTATVTPSAGAQGAAPVSVAEEFVNFDVPGSSCAESFGFCTTPVAVNPEGDVTGYYADSNVAGHAFLRRADGALLRSTPPARRAHRPIPFAHNRLE